MEWKPFGELGLDARFYLPKSRQIWRKTSNHTAVNLDTGAERVFSDEEVCVL